MPGRSTRLDFSTAEEMLRFYSENEQRYMLLMGSDGFTLAERGPGPVRDVAFVADPRAAVMAMDGLRRMASSVLG